MLRFTYDKVDGVFGWYADDCRFSEDDPRGRRRLSDVTAQRYLKMPTFQILLALGRIPDDEVRAYAAHRMGLLRWLGAGTPRDWPGLREAGFAQEDPAPTTTD